MRMPKNSLVGSRAKGVSQRPGFMVAMASVLVVLLAACEPAPAPTPTAAQVTARALPPTAAAPISPVSTPVVEDKDVDSQSRPVSPVATPQPESPIPGAAEAFVAEAKARLAQIPGEEMSAASAVVVTVNESQWRDSSLGCPREGMDYRQVVTPGYLIVLEASGTQYKFHTDTGQSLVLCLIDGQDAMEVLGP